MGFYFTLPWTVLMVLVCWMVLLLKVGLERFLMNLYTTMLPPLGNLTYNLTFRLVAVDSTDKKSSVVVDTKNIATNNKATSNSYQSASIDPIKSKNILQLLTSNNVRLDYDGLVGCFNMKNNSPAKIQQIESIPKGLGILFYSALDCETHSRLLDGAAPQTWAGKLPYEFVYNDVASFRLMKAEPPVTPVANYQNVQRAIDSRIPLRKARIFSPWIDMSIQEVTDTPGGTKPYDVVGVVKANNLSYVNLAFIVGDSVNKKPVWGGGESLESKKAVIEELKAMGVQVTISFGGEHAGGPAAKSTELANVITNATELQAAYQSVIDFYQIPSVDFDIEGAKFDQAAVDRRSIAIAGIQKANPKLRISATLEVFVEKGLSTLGTAVVTSAKNVSVQFDTINIMTMNYGSSNVPDGANGMWKYVLTSITGAATQLNSLNYNAGLGVTAMIGFNSDGVALFNQEDAVNLLKFANAADPIVNINYLGFWTLNRDINIPKGNNSVNWDASVSSGIVQTKYEFTNIFKEFEKAPQFVTFTTTTAKPTATGRPSGSTSSSLSLDFDYFLFISLFIFNYV
ncbi:hypothetical protein BC833DRAFT_603459 [Globomyces pollinis-pini]|nr:hypothetical protein BC833DRAFT_603459 [Globomyces pollinis-pini]